MQILQFLKSAFLVFLLTILTQTGGIIYLIYKPISKAILRKKPEQSKKENHRITKWLLFATLYFGINFLITPVLARKSGRVTLPIFATKEIPLQSAKWYTVLMNRHYVTPEMKNVAIDVAQKMNKKFKGTKLSYLDANFPFIEGFPLLPHLSHDDGEKLDLAFFYQNKNEALQGNPGLIGYGFCEPPKNGEFDATKNCLSKGYWQYDVLSRINLGFGKKKFQFDKERTKFMTQSFSNHKRINKLFLEPHLKTRLGLGGDAKIRFQGCHSVRHDDHLHVQL